ncbi:GNAT family N-acetyltransferase [Desulforamulus putei]|uniref:GNAT family N-acetyltransferase n=1 Tax=Desulforamulus putei TaxID=74701 RepID=UPI002FDD3CE4
MLEIINVSGQGHWQNFFEVPRRIYAQDPLWTPIPRDSERQMFNPQANPVLRHVHLECFLAMDDKRPVGRIAAITDDLLADERVGLFGCFESVNRSEVARELIKAACQSLADRGKTLVQGPATLNTTQQVGLLVEGFDLPPQLMMPYNPPYYATLLEENGFSRLLDLYSYLWRPEFTRERRKLTAVARRAARTPGLQLRSINFNDLWGEGKKLADINNEAMTSQWGFVPMDEEEAAHFLAGLRNFTDPDMLIFCEVENRTVGVCLMMPDLGPKLRAARRSGFLRNIPGLFRPTSLRVGVLAVIPEYRRRGVVALLINRAMETIIKKGYRQAELSLIMDTNKDMNSIITSAVGSKVNKIFRVYEKKL